MSIHNKNRKLFILCVGISFKNTGHEVWFQKEERSFFKFFNILWTSKFRIKEFEMPTIIGLVIQTLGLYLPVSEFFIIKCFKKPILFHFSTENRIYGFHLQGYFLCIVQNVHDILQIVIQAESRYSFRCFKCHHVQYCLLHL